MESPWNHRKTSTPHFICSRLSMHQNMRILTYKRTHIGDPDIRGIFGINDCMGSIRGYKFDAVIGIGGISLEPRYYEIDRKINWIGVGPKKSAIKLGFSPTMTFSHFALYEDKGPLLESFAPNFAKRMYNSGARFLISDYTEEEKFEAELIIEWMTLKQDSAYLIA